MGTFAICDARGSWLWFDVMWPFGRKQAGSRGQVVGEKKMQLKARSGKGGKVGRKARYHWPAW